MQSGGGKGGRKLHQAEEELWREVTGDVERLEVDRPAPDGADDAGTPEEAGLSQAAKKARRARARKPASTLPPAPALREKPKPQMPELSPGSAAGLDRRTALRLKRGQMRPEARLDLHGHTQAEAHAALGDFIISAKGAERRCVLVITGKGSLGSSDGVLRRMVPRWINQPGLRAHVLAIEPAQPRDGGAGAFYLLLRRRRPTG